MKNKNIVTLNSFNFFNKKLTQLLPIPGFVIGGDVV